MIFESSKYSSRVNDSMILANILTKINSIVYDKTFLFLAFKDNPNILDVISNICLEELDKLEEQKQDKTREDALSLYIKNKMYFEKTFFIKNSDVESLKTNKEKSDFIIKYMLKNLYGILSESFYEFSYLYFIDDFIKKNLYDCPVIVEKPNVSISAQVLSDKSEITSDLILDKNSYYSFSEKPKILYFDKNFLSLNPPLQQHGIHFEKYVIFDFDRKNFTQFQQTTYGSLLAKNLNLSFFLGTNTDKLINVVINQEMFKRIFPAGISNDVKLDKELKTIENSLPSFISNFRIGMRAVFRSVDQYPEEHVNKVIFNANKFKQTTTIGGKIFTKADFDVIKNKSLLLFSKEKQKFIKKHKHIFLANVETTPFNFANFNIVKLHEYINDKKNINDLIFKIKMNNDFASAFYNLIPVEKIEDLAKMVIISGEQNSLNKYVTDVNSGAVTATDSIKNSASNAKLYKEELINSSNSIIINKE